MARKTDMVRQPDILMQSSNIEDCRKAVQRWNRMPKDYSNAWSDSPEKTLGGFVAEEFFHRIMPKLVPSSSVPEVYHYDFLYPTRTSHSKMEVKNKCVGSRPNPTYDVSVKQEDQHCDFFVFTRMDKDKDLWVFPKTFEMTDLIPDVDAEEVAQKMLAKFPRIWLLGYLSRKAYIDSCYKVNPKDVLPNGGGHSIANGDTLNKYIKDLEPIGKLLNHYNAHNR